MQMIMQIEIVCNLPCRIRFLIDCEREVMMRRARGFKGEGVGFV